MEQDPHFAFHKLSFEGMAKAERIATSFTLLLQELSRINPSGESDGSREMAIVRTKLEEACFFAKKSMAVRAVNQA